jgi:hypothetical protein
VWSWLAGRSKLISRRSALFFVGKWAMRIRFRNKGEAVVLRVASGIIIYHHGHFTNEFKT